MSSSPPSIIYDDLPFWSAPFGMALLDTLRMEKDMNVLDIGSGSGFPMLELAGRLGGSSVVYGIDPSEDSITMIMAKKELKGIPNARIIKGFAEEIPFPDAYFNLIISNNGLNNVSNQDQVLAECKRVSEPKAQMVLTMNLPETMIEFYRVFENSLKEFNLSSELIKLKSHIFEKRKPAGFLTALIESSGFDILSVKTHEFKLRYTDGTAFLNHFFIRKAFMDPWKSVLPESQIQVVFKQIEENLNLIAAQNGELSMSVPFVCIDCERST